MFLSSLSSLKIRCRDLNAGPRTYVLGLIALVIASTSLQAEPLPAKVANAQRPLFVPGEVVIKFKESVSPNQQSAMVSNAGFTRTRSSRGLKNLARIKLDTNTSVQQAIDYYTGMDEVEFVQPNYYYYPTAVPNDPDYATNQLWGLKNAGVAIANASYPTNNPGTTGADMDLEAAWDLQTNGNCSGVIVAVVDTGVNYTHQDLAANMWTNAAEAGGAGGNDDDANGFTDDVRGWDFIGNDADPQTADGNAHGTHVAGTIGAVGNNNIGTTGVCWQVQIMPVRSLSSSGGSSTTVAAGINYAANNGAHVINLSLGGPFPDMLIRAAIENARSKDVVVVVAAGNDNRNNDLTPTSPCNENLGNIICVAALDQSYLRASFSNYGANSVDVGAPGTNILSTWAGRFLSTNFADWTYVGGGWNGNPACVGFVGAPPALVNPTDWCTNINAQYANNADNRTYRTFDLNQAGATVAAGLEYAIWYSMATGDTLKIGFDSGAGTDPFDQGADDTILANLTGNTGNQVLAHRFDLAGCVGGSCSIGFQLDSNGAGTDFGAAVVGFEINTAEMNTTNKAVINGTSMATPHVAGLAALIRSYNPDYTYAEVIESIKNGGDLVNSLSGITTSGRAADANGSLRYLTKPKGLNASVTIN